MKPIDPLAALRAFVKQHGTQRQAAVALEISTAYLSDILNGRRDFSDEILAKLGLKRSVVKA